MIRTVILGLLVLALQGVAVAQAGAQLGEKAPDFKLVDSMGKEHSLSQYLGKIVVLEWINPECPFVERHYKQKTMADLAGKFSDKNVVWLAVNTTNNAKPEDMNKWISKNDLTYPILMDNSGVVGRSYGAKTTPHMYIINGEGKLVYQGGIDDDPSGDKHDRTNYVTKALDEVVAGKDVSQPQTKPYGCSVKFGK